MNPGADELLAALAREQRRRLLDALDREEPRAVEASLNDDGDAGLGTSRELI